MMTYNSILMYIVVSLQQSLLLPDSYGQLWKKIKANILQVDKKIRVE